jgi:hypothetical protein
VAVCDPPLLLTVTPGATSLDEEVEPADDAAVSVVVVVVLSVVAESDVPADESVVSVLVVSALVSSVDADDDDATDESDVSAVASPGATVTAMPIPKAAASAPTRPM